MVNSLDEARDCIQAYLDWFDDFSDVTFAAIQGAANFTPAMLPKLWQDHPCPYSNTIYREAWYRGFYSASTWFLIDRLATMAMVAPDLRSMFEWYYKTHAANELKRVPGGSLRLEMEETP